MRAKKKEKRSKSKEEVVANVLKEEISDDLINYLIHRNTNLRTKNILFFQTIDSIFHCSYYYSLLDFRFNNNVKKYVALNFRKMDSQTYFCAAVGVYPFDIVN